MSEAKDGEILEPGEAEGQSPFGPLGQGLAAQLAGTVPTLSWVLLKWAVRVGLAGALAWLFGLWWGHVPVWIWVVIGLYAALSLALALALRHLHRRAVDVLKTRMERL